jgi:hypothetical protein
MRRIRLVIATLAVAAVAVVLPEPASAFMREPIVLTIDGPVSKTYGPIPGNFPLTTAAIPTPSGCGNEQMTAPFQTQCDRVPIKIVPPPLAGNEDFLVTLKVTWNPKEDVDGVFVNDLDLYLYDNQQIAKRTNPESTTYTEVGESAGAVQPESIKLFSPTLGDYNLVVINWSGPNVDYTVEMSMSVEGFDTPFEDLGPRFGAGRTNRPTSSEFESFAAPVDFSAFEDAAPGVGGSDFIASAPPQIGQVAALPDADFAATAAPAFDDEFEAAEAALPASLLRPRQAGPVSGVVVAFWLGLVPLLLLAALVVFVVRRSRKSFDFTAPATS